MGNCAGVVFKFLFTLINAHGTCCSCLHLCQLCPADPHLQLHGFHVGQLHQGFACCCQFVCRGIFFNDGCIVGSADGASGDLFIKHGAFGCYALLFRCHRPALGAVGFSLPAEDLHLPGEVIELFPGGGAVSEHAARTLYVDGEVVHLLSYDRVLRRNARQARLRLRRHRIKLTPLQHRHRRVGDGDDGAARHQHALRHIHADDPARGLGRYDHLVGFEGAPGIGIALTAVATGGSQEQNYWYNHSFHIIPVFCILLYRDIPFRPWQCLSSWPPPQ